MPSLPMLLARAGELVWLRAKDARDDKDAARDLVDGWIVLAAMPPDSSWVHPAAIAAETELTRHRAKRLLYTLAVLRLVEHDPEINRYRIKRWHP